MRTGIGVVVGIGLRDRGVVARLAQQVEVGDERRHLVVLRVVAVGLHRVEEPRDVLDPRLGRRGRLLRQPRQEPRRLQVAIEHLAGAQARHVRGRAVEVGDEARGGLPRLPAHARELGVGGQPAQDLEERPALPSGVTVEAQEVDLRDAVHLGAGKVEDGHGIVGVRQHAQERHQDPDFLARVQPAVAGEPVRQAADVQGAQEGIGVVVAADEDREVARAEPLGEALVDHRRHAVGLRGDGVVVDVAHRRARLALRAQALVDAGDRPPDGRGCCRR